MQACFILARVRTIEIGAHTLIHGQRERERDVEYVQELLFLFLKGMTGALAPLSYLVTE